MFTLSDYNGAESLSTLGTKSPFIHVLYGLPSIVNENVKIGDFKPATANLKFSTNRKLLPSRPTT